MKSVNALIGQGIDVTVKSWEQHTKNIYQRHFNVKHSCFYMLMVHANIVMKTPRMPKRYRGVMENQCDRVRVELNHVEIILCSRKAP